MIFGHKDKGAGSNFKITMFFGESETTTPNAVCLHNAPIYHQLWRGGINCCHLCVIIPSTGSAVVIIPHIILNKLYRWQNSSIIISLLILLLPRYLTGSINSQLTNKNNPNVHLFSLHLQFYYTFHHCSC